MIAPQQLSARRISSDNAIDLATRLICKVLDRLAPLSLPAWLVDCDATMARASCYRALL